MQARIGGRRVVSGAQSSPERPVHILAAPQGIVERFMAKRRAAVSLPVALPPPPPLPAD